MDEPLLRADGHEASEDPLAPPSSNQRQHDSSVLLDDDGDDVSRENSGRISQVKRLFLDNGSEESETESPQQQQLLTTSLEETTHDQPHHHVAGAVVNLCSATLGAGILSLPYSFYQAGLVIGTVLLVLAAIATIWSIDLLTAAVQFYSSRRGDGVPTDTYELLARNVLGRPCQVLVQVCMILFCGGCAVAYCIAVGDILELSGHISILKHTSSTESLLVVWATVMLPLSLLRTMKSLQISSAIGMASIVTLVFAAAVHLIQDDFDGKSDHDGNSNSTNSTVWSSDADTQENGTDTQVDWNKLLWPANGVLSVLQACPIILFAFSCQVNCCAIYQELPNLPQSTGGDKLVLMQKVTRWAVLLCATLYCCISCIGLADFGVSLDPNILKNYAPPVGIMQVACACMAAAVTMAFPLNIFPARVTLEQVYKEYQEAYTVTATTGLPLEPEPNATLTAALLEDLEREASGQLLEDQNDPGSNAAGGGEEEGSGPEVELQHENGENVAPSSRVHFARPEHTTIPQRPSDFSSEDHDDELQRHVMLTLILAGTALGLALLIPDISIVFGLLGGTTSSVLGFCIPGALGLRMVREQATPSSSLWGTWIISWLLLVGGILVAFVTTAVTVYTTLF